MPVQKVTLQQCARSVHIVGFEFWNAKVDALGKPFAEQ